MRRVNSLDSIGQRKGESTGVLSTSVPTGQPEESVPGDSSNTVPTDTEPSAPASPPKGSGQSDSSTVSSGDQEKLIEQPIAEDESTTAQPERQPELQSAPVIQQQGQPPEVQPGGQQGPPREVQLGEQRRQPREGEPEGQQGQLREGQQGQPREVQPEEQRRQPPEVQPEEHPQDHRVDGADGAEVPAANRPVRQQGINQVWQVLVEGHRRRHHARQLPDEEKIPGASAASAISTIGGVSAGILNTAASHRVMDNGREAENSDDYDPENPTNSMKERSMQANWIRGAAGVSSMISTGAGLYSSIQGIRYARRNGQRNRKRKAIFDTVAGASGFLGGLTSTISAGMGLGGADATATGVVGTVGTGLVGLGSLTRISGSIVNTVHHSKAAFRAGMINKIHSQQDQSVLGAPEHEKSKVNGGNQKDAARNLAKARLYAMEQAKKFNRAKAVHEGVNALSETVFGLGSVGMSLAGGINSLIQGSKAGAIRLGGRLGIASSITKLLGTAVGGVTKKVANHASKGRMHEVVNGYINNKKASIVREANDKLDNAGTDPEKLNQQEIDLVARNEKIQEKIAIARLGINVTLDDNSSISEDIYKRLFKEITFRRAENVHRAGGELLKALGLPDGASVEEIAEALGYEG